MTCGPIGILGSSATGVALAVECAKADLPVIIFEADASARERAQVFARREASEFAEQIAFGKDLAALDQTRLIFDALDPEDRDRFEWELRTQATLATPWGSSLKGFPEERQVRFVPFQPLHLRHLTELTPFSKTTEGTLLGWQSFARQINRVPVTLPVGVSSIGLRLLDRMHAAADDLLLRGAILWELDEAMTAFGFDIGFYEAQDLTGLDIAYARRKAQGRPSPISDRAVEEGRIGKKIGWGWYRYPGGGGAVIDPLIEDLIREEAWFAKVEQGSYDADAIIEALLNALREELGAIQSNKDVDLAQIMAHGLGYPHDKLPELGL